jgi:hypothetical protein
MNVYKKYMKNHACYLTGQLFGDMIMIHHIVGGYGLFPASGDGIMRRKIIWQRKSYWQVHAVQPSAQWEAL